MTEKLPLIRIHKRAKHIILRHDPFKGFILTMNAHSQMQRALQLWREFLSSSAKGPSKELYHPALIALGAMMPFQGKEYRIQKSENVLLRKVELTPPEQGVTLGNMLICPRVKNPQKTIKEFFYHTAYEVLHGKSSDAAAKAGVCFEKIVIKDMKSRWGSCSKSGNLSYSWRILMAPEPVIEYLCAHEVAHLIHFDHSKAFWQVVESLCPNAKEKRKWLKENGAQLMRYQFDV